jgi:uncharacterized protein
MEVGKTHIIFDPLYGFISLNSLEWEIIHSPFYQRLRWIKQLGFSCYVFPGAEHTRYTHSIGALYNSHKILSSCSMAVSDEELFDPKCMHKEARFHKSIRISALMHDMGTFPFSHTTESSYIKVGKKLKNKTKYPHDHEYLGAYIIKNTDFPGGITYILKKYGFTPDKISELVSGESPDVFSNQVLHSEIDCDRMDYLLRDAYYTGLKYGTYDWDYLTHHFRAKDVGGQKILTIKANALHCVEDFLTARFAWYSQVLRSPRGAKFDALAEKICSYLLEKQMILSYEDLLNLIKGGAEGFYQFNDQYFMTLIYKYYTNGDFDKNPKIKDMVYCLLFGETPKAIKLDEFKQRLLIQDDTSVNEKHSKKAFEKAQDIQDLIAKKGGPREWVIPDIPTKNIVFVKSKGRIIKGNSKSNILLERDPVKISFSNGDIKVLADIDNSIISRLQNTLNFAPNVFCSKQAYKTLLDEKVI